MKKSYNLFRVNAFKKWWWKILAILAIISSVSMFSVRTLANQSSMPTSIPIEVKDPIEIIDYPSGFSLFPGETLEFNVTLQNIGPMNYSCILEFSLNDTAYQNKHIEFSNEIYTVVPGKQTLSAWLTVSPTAAPASLLLTIKHSLTSPSSSETEPEQSTDDSTSQTTNATAHPAYELLGGGARWAAREGKTVLYINWKDNWLNHLNHYSADGSSWTWFSQSTMDEWRNSVSQTLEQWGFEVTFAGDMPETLSDYDLVVIEASYAVEPRHAPLVKEYISNGGGVVILAGVPCYFSVYCRDWWPYRFGGTNLASIQEWFGGRFYANAGGVVRAVVNNPVGTSLHANDVVHTRDDPWGKSIVELNSNAQVIARWDSGEVYAFTHEYGEGRVFYHGGQSSTLSTQNESS
jgi:hypothetical protein